jgi:hypothetical protein
VAKDEVEFDVIALTTKSGKEIHIVATDDDPNIAGKDSPVGSICLSSQGTFVKQTEVETDWGGEGGNIGSPSPVTIENYLDRHSVATLTPMTTTLTNLITYLELDFEAKHDASYKISATYIWDLKTTRSSFMAQLLVNDVVCWEHVQEPKDSKDQKLIQSYPDLVLPLLKGVNKVELKFATIKKKKKATIQSAGITVERWNT